MSARDKHYKPRRFREDSDDLAERKLKNSRSADKYMASADEEYASEPGHEQQGHVRYPSRVKVPSEDTPVRKKQTPAPKKPSYKAPKKKEPVYREPVKAEPLKEEKPAYKEPVRDEKPVKTEPLKEEKPEIKESVREAKPEVKEPVREEKSEVKEPVREEKSAHKKHGKKKQNAPKAPAENAVPVEGEEAVYYTPKPVKKTEPVIEEAEKKAPEAAEDLYGATEKLVEEAPEIDTAKNDEPHKAVYEEAISNADSGEGFDDRAADAAEAEASREGSADDDIDYIMPEKPRIRRHHHHHHHHHENGEDVHSETDELDDEDDYLLEDDNPDHYTQLRQKPKRKKSKAKKVLISILCVILALIIGALSTFFIMREIGRKKMHSYDRIEISAPAKDESGNPIDTLDATGRVIKYDGVSYTFNENVISVVFIGTDNGTAKYEGKLMGDAIYCMTIDTKTGDVKILGISRDTMSDVDVYSDEGGFIDTEKLQMAYAYSYNSPTVTGGRNTLTSISRLFYGLPMKDYFAINLDALTTLNDAIGGVTLTSSMTFESPEDGRTIIEGETVTLHGKEAEKYVQSRDTAELESNNDRMQRQQEYIRAFISQIFPAAKKDMSVITNLYSAIKDNSDTTLDLTKITYLASVALSHLKSASDIEYVNLPGKIVQGEHAELYVSNEDAIRTMLMLFYKPISTSATPDSTTKKGSIINVGVTNRAYK